MTHRPPAGWARAAAGLISASAVCAVAWAVAVVGGPSTGAVPFDAAQVETVVDAEPAVWAVLVVRVAALCLALRWLAVMGAAWTATLRGHHQRAQRLAGQLPAPLRLALSLSLSPMMMSMPSVAGAQQQPPSGAPTSIATAGATSTLATDAIDEPSADTSAVLQLTPMPTGPDSNRSDAKTPTAGTTPAPALPPPAPDLGSLESERRNPADTSCPTIVTRSDVHWFDQARDHLDDQLGRRSSADEAEDYWDRCVAHNADRLIDPSEPDVVAPGQPLELPELPRTL